MDNANVMKMLAKADHIPLLKSVAKLVKHKLPDKYASNGLPKADSMADAKSLYTAKTKAEVIEGLLALSAAQFINYRHDIRRVALTKEGLDAVGHDDKPSQIKV